MFRRGASILWRKRTSSFIFHWRGNEFFIRRFLFVLYDYIF